MRPAQLVHKIAKSQRISKERGMSRSPTLREVASKAGVSITTVSRVINEGQYVSEAKRLKVEGAIEALGFKPNIQAQRLKQKGDRSYQIGLLYDNPTAHYISRLLVGTLEWCEEYGYRLALECLESERDDPHPSRSSRLADRTDLDGLILTPPLSDDLALLEELEKRGHHIVRLVPFRDRHHTPYVYMDDYGAAKQLGEYLIGLGHTKIAHIQGDPRHGSAAARLSGFMEAMACAKLEVPQDWVVEGDYTFETALSSALRLLDSEERPTAIFAANDESALATLFAAERLGIRVPHELSVVGFDDLPLSSIVKPGITTIQQPLEQMADEAAGLLIALHEGRLDLSKPEPPNVLVAHHLVERESTSTAPNP